MTSEPRPPAPPNYSNVTLMQAMGAKKYDPMPTDQHQWQRAKGDSMIHRIWSVLCACSLHARLIGNRLVTTPYATEDDGVSPLTLVRLAKLLGEEDGGNVRQAWRSGEQMGIWRRESGKLWLNGHVTAAQVSGRREAEQKVCTHRLTSSELLKIKGWPKEKRERWERVWTDAHALEQARCAEAVGRVRDEMAPVKDSIKTSFGLEVRHIQQPARRTAVVPPSLLQFVQTGGDPPENGIVQTAATLLPAENNQRLAAASSKSSGEPARAQPDENPERNKVSNIPIPNPPDMAAAENTRRQAPEPPNRGGEQSRDQGSPDAADITRYVAGVHATAAEVGLQLPPDNATARAWWARAVPLATVRHALFLGAHRHLTPAAKGAAIASIHSLAFFDPVIEELLSESEPGEGYWSHVENRFRVDRKRVEAGEFRKSVKQGGST